MILLAQMIVYLFILFICLKRQWFKSANEACTILCVELKLKWSGNHTHLAPPCSVTVRTRLTTPWWNFQPQHFQPGSSSCLIFRTQKLEWVLMVLQDILLWHHRSIQTQHLVRLCLTALYLFVLTITPNHCLQLLWLLISLLCLLVSMHSSCHSLDTVHAPITANKTLFVNMMMIIKSIIVPCMQICPACMGLQRL